MSPVQTVRPAAGFDAAVGELLRNAVVAQVERSVDRDTGGLGIGLGLVKGLVEMHGGSVRAKSEGLGRGSTFVVRLPLLPA